jgi:hypothetical protein
LHFWNNDQTLHTALAKNHLFQLKTAGQGF